MSHRRDKEYDNFEDYLGYEDPENEEEFYETGSSEEDDRLMDDQVNSPELVDVSPLLCKTHEENFSVDCSHCKALKAVIPKAQMAQLIGNLGSS